ncbi:P-protein [Methanoculleus chikugoensis]|jgi:prephenate dehydratase|uniref:p-protein n=1 Tax=Methanoculleus chikugoensis TaxID=118126 RepID=A0A1M4MP79_9EURY|nr:prephenate dehydratase domain-containing protein [Methanoculleus chikugoensis]MDD4567651.1 prephenate dehydratase domain-containing protein [Methanoculleus chikugoensis]NMA11476.1 ACT domain-containing protein [Methanomicrobiales archaeon]SCL76735.1 P-protein [Methanoculleus chikugoensis]
MTVATLGPAGTVSHELATRLYGDDIELLPTIRAIIKRVAAGGAKGLVPIENSEAGGVGETLQGLMEFEVSITGEAYMPVRHHLAARGDPARLSVVYAHPQTHEQCSVLLDSLGVEVVHTSSNAASAMAMQKDENAGAIVSETAARIYGLPIADRDVQNSRDNTTRFVEISALPRGSAGATKCSLLVDPELDRVGLLADILAVFARRGINLTRIESRPSRRGMGKYLFFIDMEITEGWREAKEELKSMTTVRELGCYARMEVPI